LLYVVYDLGEETRPSLRIILKNLLEEIKLVDNHLSKQQFEILPICGKYVKGGQSWGNGKGEAASPAKQRTARFGQASFGAAEM